MEKDIKIGDIFFYPNHTRVCVAGFGSGYICLDEISSNYIKSQHNNHRNIECIANSEDKDYSFHITRYGEAKSLVRNDNSDKPLYTGWDYLSI